MRPATLILLVTLASATQATTAQSPSPTGGTITGFVLVDNRPAAGVTVTLGTSRAGNLTGLTDAHGRYSVRDLPPAEYRVRPIVPGYAVAGDLEYQRVRIVAGDPPHEVNFVLLPAGGIEGQLTDAAGTPIEHAGVYLVKLTSRNAAVPGRAIPVARTDAGGNYHFTEVQPGRYQIYAKPYRDPTMAPAAGDTRADVVCYHPAGITATSARILTVTAEDVLTGADVRCGEASRGFVATGQVVDGASGSAVPDAALIYGSIDETEAASVLNSTNVKTDSVGRFSVPGLAPGRYWVGLLNSRSRAGFGRPVFFTVTSADVHGLRVQVERGVALTGQVIVSGATAPPGLTVEFEPRRIAPDADLRGDRINVAFSRSAPVGADGRFVLDDVPPGRGRIRLAHDGGKFAIRVQQNGQDAAGLEVVAAPGADPIAVFASPGAGTIRGHLRSDAGRLNATGIEVIAFFQDGGASFSRRTSVDAEGRFVLDGLPPGDYQVMAVAHSATGSESRIGPVVRVQLELSATAEVEIDLRRQSGRLHSAIDSEGCP